MIQRRRTHFGASKPPAAGSRNPSPHFFFLPLHSLYTAPPREKRRPAVAAPASEPDGRRRTKSGRCFLFFSLFLSCPSPFLCHAQLETRPAVAVATRPEERQQRHCGAPRRSTRAAGAARGTVKWPRGGALRRADLCVCFFFLFC